MIRSAISASSPWPRAEIQRISPAERIRKIKFRRRPTTARVAANADLTLSRSAGWIFLDRISNVTFFSFFETSHRSYARSSMVMASVSTFPGPQSHAGGAGCGPQMLFVPHRHDLAAGLTSRFACCFPGVNQQNSLFLAIRQANSTAAAPSAAAMADVNMAAAKRKEARRSRPPMKRAGYADQCAGQDSAGRSRKIDGQAMTVPQTGRTECRRRTPIGDDQKKSSKEGLWHA